MWSFQPTCQIPPQRMIYIKSQIQTWKQENLAFPLRFTKRHDFWKSSAPTPKLCSTISTNLGTTLATLCRNLHDGKTWKKKQKKKNIPHCWLTSRTKSHRQRCRCGCRRLCRSWRGLSLCRGKLFARVSVHLCSSWMFMDVHGCSWMFMVQNPHSKYKAYNF